jgi:hypothetical protein
MHRRAVDRQAVVAWVGIGWHIRGGQIRRDVIRSDDDDARGLYRLSVEGIN